MSNLDTCIYLLMKQFIDNQKKKKREREKFTRPHYFGRKWDISIAPDPEGCMISPLKADLTRIVLYAIQMEKYPLIWLLGSRQLYCLLHGMEAKSQGREREEREKSNIESTVSRWKRLRWNYKEMAVRLFLSSAAWTKPAPSLCQSNSVITGVALGSVKEWWRK